MKRIITYLLISFFVLLTTGCGGIQTAELSDRLIMEAIGIDAENGKISVTIQALDIGADGSGKGSSANEETKIYNFTDTSTGRAFAHIKYETGLTPLYSHARILVIGEEAAKTNLGEILDFFLREYTARSDILIAAAAGQAADIVSADITDGQADAAVIEKILRNGHERGENILMPLYKFVNLLLTESDTAMCPLLSLSASENKDKKNVTVSGTAFFDSQKRIRTEDIEITEGILLLNGDAGSLSFSIDSEGKKCTLNTVKCSTKIKPSVKDGKAFFYIKTTLLCDLTEYVSDITEAVEIQDTKNAEKQLEEIIGDKEKRVLEIIFHESGMDICRFGRRILLRYPEFYKKYILNMSELTDYDLTVEATIRRTGRETIR